MTPDVVFTVEGDPIPKGSWRSATRRGRKVFFPDNPRSIPWGNLVRLQARIAWSPRKPSTSHARVEMVFHVTRPASHYGTGRNAGIVKPDAPAYPTPFGSGDLDKLERAVLDALTGVVWKDDSQVVDMSSVKRYGKGGVIVSVTFGF